MTSFINSYLLLHILATCGLAFSALIRFVNRRGYLKLKTSSELKLSYLALGLTLILPLLSLGLKENSFYEPLAKVESAATLRSYDLQSAGLNLKPVLTIGKVQSELPVDLFANVMGLLVLTFLAFGILKAGQDLWKLRDILKSSYQIRRTGSAIVAVSGQIQVPFSIRLGGAWVLVPTDFLSDAEKFKMSVLHELQHHRQRDTEFIYVILVLKSLLFLNPFMWAWEKILTEIQEIACDENLIDQGKVNRRAYASCLIEIAETAVKQREQPVCATGLIFLNDQHSISRRIEAMFQKRKNRTLTFGLMAAAVSLTLAGTAFAAKGLISDRRISMPEALRMAEVAKANTDFPIIVNAPVLRQLNRYLGTEEGRKFIQDSIERMQTYRPMIETKISQYYLPSELMAIGIVESGYQNLPQVPNKTWSAGVWMFIESTARTFGLRVDSTIDERLNVNLETDAAMRYLASNHLRFKDWLLAIQAYNSGEKAVQDAIEKTGTRDVWALLRAGLSTDTDYLARVMAVTLILKNPSVLN